MPDHEEVLPEAKPAEKPATTNTPAQTVSIGTPVQQAVRVTDKTFAIPSNSAGSTDRKSSVAQMLAMVIVWAFCLSVFWLLAESAFLLYKLTADFHLAAAQAPPPGSTAVSSKDAFEFISSAMLPFLKETASTVASIFGPTLGFVVGYYFKNDSEK